MLILGNVCIFPSFFVSVDEGALDQRCKFVDMAIIYCVNEVSNVAHVTTENSQF